MKVFVVKVPVEITEQNNYITGSTNSRKSVLKVKVLANDAENAASRLSFFIEKLFNSDLYKGILDDDE
jgi:hypothetical protein